MTLALFSDILAEVVDQASKESLVKDEMSIVILVVSLPKNVDDSIIFRPKLWLEQIQKLFQVLQKELVNHSQLRVILHANCTVLAQICVLSKGATFFFERMHH